MSRNRLTANGRAPARPPLALDLREQVMAALERLSVRQSVAKLESRRETNAQFLSEVLAALDDLHPESLPAVGAGFGSSVVVKDVGRGTEHTYTLMTGPMLDIEAGHVSLASPIGRALLGKRAGEDVIVEAPQRRMHLRIVSVSTLQERIATNTARARRKKLA
jgi:transcription elongation factor GreA